MKIIRKNGPSILIPSFFTIHPTARKGSFDFSLKELLTGVSVEFFMNADADAMVANLRIDKKVNESCARWGADLIRSNVHVSGGICGDLMVFYKEKIRKRVVHELQNEVRALWNNRIIIPRARTSEDHYFLNGVRKAA